MGKDEVLHEGALEVQLRGGEPWGHRFVEVLAGKLQWYAVQDEDAEDDDRGEVAGEVLLNADADVRNLPFGLKKFMFTVSSEGAELKLAASGEAEKLDWIEALRAACNMEADHKSRKHVASVRANSFVDLQERFKEDQKKKESTDDDLEAIISSIQAPAAASTPPPWAKYRKSTGKNKPAARFGRDEPKEVSPPAATEEDDDPEEEEEEEAAAEEDEDEGGDDSWIKKDDPLNVRPATFVLKMTPAERVQEKLEGNVSFATTTPTCSICNKRVFAFDSVNFEGKKVHKACLACSTCGERLTPTNVSKIGEDMYCRKHYLAALRSSTSRQSAERPQSNSRLSRRKSLKALASSAMRRMSGRQKDVSKPLDKMDPVEETEEEVNADAAALDHDEEPEEEEVEEVVKPKARAPGRISNSRLASVRLINFAAPPPKREVEVDEDEEDDLEEDLDAEDDGGVDEAPKAPKPAAWSRPEDADEDDAEESSPKLEHVALSRPMIRAPRRRRPPPANAHAGDANLTPTNNKLARLTHGLTFKLDDGAGSLLTMYSASASERDQWVQRIASAIHLKQLEAKLIRAQRKDMLSSLQAKAELENFQKTGDFEYEGFIELMSGKPRAPNWKRRYCVLSKDAFQVYSSSNTKGKRPSKHVEFCADSAVLDVHHRILKPAL